MLTYRLYIVTIVAVVRFGMLKLLFKRHIILYDLEALWHAEPEVSL